MKERLRSVELDPFLLKAFAETFISRWDSYPLQVEDGTYTRVPEKLTLTLIFKHLTNARLGLPPFTLGAYALDAKSQAKWVCFDADAEQPWSDLRRLSQSLHSENVPTYLETSRRGGHLWLFTPQISGADIRRFAQSLLIMQQVAEFGPDRKRRIEIYPKQAVLDGGPGSFVRLPFGLHRKSGQIYHFVDIEGRPLASTVREQLRLLVQPQRISQDFIATILTQEVIVPPPPPKPSPKFKKRKPRWNEPLSETLKHAISVFDFVQRYVVLNDQGHGFCPFHDDQAKSFAVNKERNYWHCFAGCGGGSIIDFWSKWRETHGQDASFTATVIELRHLLLSS